MTEVIRTSHARVVTRHGHVLASECWSHARAVINRVLLLTKVAAYRT